MDSGASASRPSCSERTETVVTFFASNLNVERCALGSDSKHQSARLSVLMD